jgi:hypothetical protein
VGLIWEIRTGHIKPLLQIVNEKVKKALEKKLFRQGNKSGASIRMKIRVLHALSVLRDTNTSPMTQGGFARSGNCVLPICITFGAICNYPVILGFKIPAPFALCVFKQGTSGSESIFFWAEAGHPTPKAGKNKTIGEQPGGEIQSGNG